MDTTVVASLMHLSAYSQPQFSSAPKSSPLIDWTRFDFLDQMKLWCSPDTKDTEAETEELGNVITLSEAFYNEIDATEFRSKGRKESRSSFGSRSGRSRFQFVACLEKLDG